MTRAQMRTGYAAARQRTCLPAEELVSGIVGVLDGLVDAAAAAPLHSPCAFGPGSSDRIYCGCRDRGRLKCGGEALHPTQGLTLCHGQEGLTAG